MKKSLPKINLKTFTPEPTKKEEMNIKNDSPVLELNQLLQRRILINSQGSISWKVYLFPAVHQQGWKKITHQYFGLDLVEAETERTFWTHKPNIWQDLFATVKEYAMTGQVEPISSMFDGVLCCPVRAVSKGPNEVQTFLSGKGQKVQHWIMLIPMPIDIDAASYVQEFLSSFQKLCKKQYIRSAYKSAVVQITQHLGFINHISEDGNYWYVIDNAVQKDVIIRSCTCLSEVLLDFTIKEVISLMFGVGKNSDTWTDVVKTYAFGVK